MWGDIIEWTSSVLFELKGFGEGGALAFLVVCVQTSAEACVDQCPPARAPLVDTYEPRLFPPRTGYQASQLRRLVDWAVNEVNAKSVNDLVTACSITSLPDDIRLINESLHAMRLADVFPGIVREEGLETLVCRSLRGAG